VFEAEVYGAILKRMMDRAKEWEAQNGEVIDTREGSMIRSADTPVAMELAQVYMALLAILNEAFADTETRPFLIRRCAERGIIVEPATYAVRRGVFNIPVPIGSRFSLNKINYVVIAPLDGDNNAYSLRCETAGNVGNIESGTLIPIVYIDGLTRAVLSDILIPGEDEESTEHLRQRYFASLNAQAYGGNIQDYVEKTLALDGVGGVKVYPVWNGGGTVKLVIIDTLYNPPSGTLIDAVQTAIDPILTQG
jgi:uncharacterized phage protein gp47/JayE